MATMKVRHLVEKSGGRFYWQPAAPLRRAGWRPVRLHGDAAAAIAKAEALNAEVDAWRRGEVAPNAPAAAARRGRKAAPGTVEALILEYKASRFWTTKAPKTQQEYGWALETIRGWAGDMPARAVTPPAVQAFYAAQLRRVEGSGKARRVIETPAKAAAVIRVLRLLLQVGVRLGYVTSNAAAKPGLVVTRQRDPLPWSRDQVAHMVATADGMGWRSIGTAILLNEWIGQREADVLALRPWAVELEALRLRQGKTGRQVVLPVQMVPHLVARLKAERSRDGAVLSPAVALAHDRNGQPWNGHTFRHVFAEIRAKAAETMPSCADLRFMELRHTAVTRLHDAGADALAISRVTGHSPKTAQSIIDQHYLVASEGGAARAFAARMQAERGG
jgi:hypothetical protein